MAYPLSKRLLGPLLAKRIDTLSGVEHIPTSGPTLVVANHIGYQDPILMVTALVLHTGRKVHAVAKWKSLRVPGLKRWFGIIPLYKDKQKTLELARKRLEEGDIVLVYPEGTVNFSDTLLRSKTGAARLALWTGCPVVPVGLQRISAAPKNSFYKYAEILTGHMKVSFGKVLQFSKSGGLVLSSDLVHSVHNKILQEVAQLADKKYIPVQ